MNSPPEKEVMLICLESPVSQVGVSELDFEMREWHEFSGCAPLACQLWAPAPPTYTGGDQSVALNYTV